MKQDATLFALIFNTHKVSTQTSISFSDFSTVMGQRLTQTIDWFLEAPLHTINRLQHEKPQTSGVVQAYLDLFKSRQTQKETLKKVFSILELSPHLFAIVCDMDLALGTKAPQIGFYQHKFLHDFSPLESQHFDWSENVSEIYNHLKMSFIEDKIERLAQTSTTNTPSLSFIDMWQHIAQNLNTAYSTQGVEGLLQASMGHVGKPTYHLPQKP